ncbi:NAD(P)/FAD-dependent oxidoreductase [Liquorilactobacillus capillatus]|uniref:Putidaredoxin reductase n=1 Tax=Liquorilactobacillus capillatus DSM 19910 TaxID=1423731 RepID=A0A0R1M5R2_9LACO|nr:NAD(P)/FAD-dependent oxidoreductase [Liquorilactobacillus capillatus]KRL00485.1 putidaredoxin reductase [Liquorilactobacillus capillatus DSM 19910]
MSLKSKHFNYLLIGGGMAADQAAAGIRSIDASGSIGIISADSDAPYARPALSKKLWVDPDFTEDDTDLQTAEKNNTTLFLQTQVTQIKPKDHLVTTADNKQFSYDKLLLATGSSPQKLSGPASDLVVALRSKADYRRIRSFSQTHKHVIVVGNGYIGNEIAAGLIQNDVHVSLVISDHRLYEKKFPLFLSKAYQQRYLDAGVKIYPETRAVKYEVTDKHVKLFLENGTILKGDGLVLGLGAQANLDLAEKIPLSVDNYGVIVDEQLKTSVHDIWAAGDIISYPDAILGRQKAGHVNHAIKSGYTAGQSMAGAPKTYDHTPYFYSWVFDINWEALGHVSSSSTMYAEKMQHSDGSVIYYFDKDDYLQGVLLWNTKINLDHYRNILKKKPQLAVLQQIVPLQKV